MNIRVLTVILGILAFAGCTKHYIPKTGDLLFQDLDCGGLCDAIEKVTTGFNGTNLSHVGIVSVEHDTTFVYEAIGQDVKKTVFSKFLERSRDSSGKPKVLAGRIDKKYDYTIPGAIQVCRDLLHKPYDGAFDLQNESYYCSELVYFAFKDSLKNKLFTVNPMTFKDPATGKTFQAWKEYFKELNMDIPEGKPGLNPGGISRSPIVHIVFKYY